MVSAHATVLNPSGLHMRPAQRFVQGVSAFGCEVTLLFGEKRVNAKSIMQVMLAGITQGSTIEICCDGPDEAAALQAALDLIASGLGE
ncbi:MAG: HPr family phosphocarrier protein [Ruminococcaceae bacterium]|nr:HPr family phosphocarrier protein [Oscillospiraceae bacterium]